MSQPHSFQLDILRHGATTVSGAFLGSTDADLTTAGHEAMLSRVRGRHWAAVHTSPLERCRAFAARLHHDTVVEQGLAEYHFGRWDGRSVKDLRREDPAAVDAFWIDPEGAGPPGAEPLQHFRHRVHRAVETLVGNRFRSPDPVLLVTHAGVMRVLLEQFLHLPLKSTWNIEIPPAGLMRLEFDVLDGEILHTRLARLEGN